MSVTLRRVADLGIIIELYGSCLAEDNLCNYGPLEFVTAYVKPSPAARPSAAHPTSTIIWRKLVCWSSQAFVETRLAAAGSGLEVIWVDSTDVAVTSPRIVERFDVIGNVNRRHLASVVYTLFNSLFLEACKERLGNCIVQQSPRRLMLGLRQFFLQKRRQSSLPIYARGPWRSLEAVEYATPGWVDWFNQRRLLEPIGHVPPAEFEEAYSTTTGPGHGRLTQTRSLPESRGGSPDNLTCVFEPRS
jgi:transposase InsO family protein